jgi:hypothetical protein
MNQEIAQRPVITVEAVTSSQIAAIGHHPETNTLAIQFPDKKDGSKGSLYHYENVTAEQYAEFKNAESLGSHFIRKIKKFPDLFPHTRIS